MDKIAGVTSGHDLSFHISAFLKPKRDLCLLK